MRPGDRRVAIIGGGVLGLTMAYDLTRAGASVTLYERAPRLGGLAGSMPLGGLMVDRFYHCILGSDGTLFDLLDELALSHRLRFTETKMGFLCDGRLLSMSTPLEFLTFPAIGLVDRLRLGLTIVRSNLIRDWRGLDGIPLEAWLTRWSGRRTYERIWLPLLRAKFDSAAGQIPATYMWARIRRMSSTRDRRTSRENMGYLIGGYQTLVDGLEAAIKRLGGTIHVGTGVEQVIVEAGRAAGVRTARGVSPADQVVCTLQHPYAARLLPPSCGRFAEVLGRLRYLGIVCLVLKVKAPLSPFYTVNITDPHVPFTGIIETTNLIDRTYTGGSALVYLPKYVAEGSPYARMDDREVFDEFTGHLTRIFPGFDAAAIEAWTVSRERYAEPIHPLNAAREVLPIRSPIAGLYLANSSQIYPALVNCEAITAFARHAAAEVLGDRAAPASRLVPA